MVAAASVISKLLYDAPLNHLMATIAQWYIITNADVAHDLLTAAMPLAVHSAVLKG
jgi:hypothetical protein